eukprot:gene57276-biopygen111322
MTKTSDDQSSVPANLHTIAFHAIAAGADHTCAIRRDDGGAECWGKNEDGQATPPDAGPYGIQSRSTAAPTHPQKP